MSAHEIKTVAIVGGGYTGLSTALHLAKRGIKAVVLEAGPVGFGGAGRNVGLVNAGMWVMPDELPNVLGAVHGDRLLTLLGDAPAAVFEIVRTYNIACELRTEGTLHCAVGPTGLEELKARSFEVAVFGDIDLQPHRDWEEKVCARAGLQCYLPLWHESRLALAHEVLRLGFRAIVVCVDSRHLDDRFCGRLYDAAFIADLPAGVDACGENGEFHTFVYDGPGFSTPVRYVLANTESYTAPVDLGGVRYCFARLESG